MHLAQRAKSDNFGSLSFLRFLSQLTKCGRRLSSCGFIDFDHFVHRCRWLDEGRLEEGVDLELREVPDVALDVFILHDTGAHILDALEMPVSVEAAQTGSDENLPRQAQ